MLPFSRKARPPNIFFSTIPLVSPTAARTRFASASSKAIESTLEAAHRARCHHDRGAVVFEEPGHGHPDVADSPSVLVEVGLEPGGGRRLLENSRRTDQNGHIVAVRVRVEVQGDVRVAGNVSQFCPCGLAQDENGSAVPMKPHRPGLRYALLTGG